MTMRVPLARLLWAAPAVAAALLLLGVVTAGAHVRTSDGYAEIRDRGDHVDVRLSLEYEILARATGMGTAAIDAPDDPARNAALTEHHDLVERYLTGRVEVAADRVRCDLTLDGTGLEERPASDTAAAAVPYAVLDLDFDCHGSTSGQYVVRYSVFSGRPASDVRPGPGTTTGTGSDAVVDDHTCTVVYDLGGERGQAVLDGGTTSFSAGEQEAGPAALRALGLGVERALGGLDHALFVAALALGATTLAGLMGRVALFALAQSLALTVASATSASLPAGVVGPLVALTVVYTAGAAAGTALGGTQPRFHLPVVAVAGALHGLALAGELRFDGPFGRELVTSFGGAVAGLQAGHLLLAAALFPLIALARRYAWSAVAQLAAAGAVAITGLTWFVYRLL